jgi:exonuclease VII large subunit
MAQNEEGTVIRSVEQTKIGDRLMVSVSDGVISTTVTDIKENAL